jgi:hypothetical protein
MKSVFIHGHLELLAQKMPVDQRMGSVGHPPVLSLQFECGLGCHKIRVESADRNYVKGLAFLPSHKGILARAPGKPSQWQARFAPR